MQTALIRNLPDGNIKIITEDENNKVTIAYSPKWNLKLLKPISSHFSLSPQQNELFSKAIRSRRGMKILDDLKNRKLDVIINEFLEVCQKRVFTHEKAGYGNHWSKVRELLEQIKKETLDGKNGLQNYSMGLSKKQIWNAFLQKGLIKLK